MHSFWATDLQKAGQIISLAKAEREHLFRILRARPGEQIQLLDGTGKVALATIQSEQSLQIDQLTKKPEPAVKVHLFTAAPRKQKLDQVLKQATELGAWSINVVNCRYSVAVPDNVERWRELTQEACKQSGNPFLPRLTAKMSFKQALDQCAQPGWLASYGAVQPVGEAEPDLAAVTNIAYWVGPEGGFAPEEIASFQAKKFVGIHLAPYILRLETAAIAGLTIWQKRVLDV